MKKNLQLAQSDPAGFEEKLAHNIENFGFEGKQ